MNNLVFPGPIAKTGAGETLNFVTLLEFQNYINEPAVDAATDARMQQLIDSASYGAFSAMGGRFLLRPATEFDYVMASVAEGSTLFLPQYPVGTISRLDFGYMSANGVWVQSLAVPTSEYYVDSETGRVYGAWPTSMHSVRVTWPGGYPAAELPEDAKEAVMMTAAVKLQRARRSRWDVKTLTAGSEGYTYFESDIPPVAAGVFQKYSLPTSTIGAL